MNRLVASIITIVLVTFLVTANTHANWPAWRGPDSTGAAGSGNPPIEWSETKNIKWKVKVPGESLSSPIIWENKIFFLTAIKTDKPTPTTSDSQTGGGGRRRMSRPPTAVYSFDLVCMDRNTGSITWQKTAREEFPHEGHHSTASFASNSAITDGKFVWAGFGSRGIYCYDMDGNKKWERDLGNMTIVAGFGEGSSAALAGNALIVVMDHEGDSFIYALDKENGRTLWQKPRDERTSWSTPLPIEVNGKTQIIVNATNFVRSYDLQTGDVIWQCGGQTRNVIPCPVTGFGKVICMSGFRGNTLHAIELGRAGDLSGSNAIKWQVNSGTPYVPSPLLYGDKLYFCSGNRPTISCYQADTGKANYTGQSLEGLGDMYASPVGVADRIYFVSRNGTAAVIKNSDTFELLATNKLDDGFDASPAIVGDELYLKGKQNFYCIAE
ncbi:MAG: PQQ-binding-like beta-propeller repeat protein [Phycisphaerales bacterium]|jgi:outer membrane protein assembly factor BamB